MKHQLVFTSQHAVTNQKPQTYLCVTYICIMKCSGWNKGSRMRQSKVLQFNPILSRTVNPKWLSQVVKYGGLA